LQLLPNPPIDPMTVIGLIQRDRNFKLAGPDRLVWSRSTAMLKDRVAAVKELFKKLVT
jgi:transcription-repair coupling factor (superfamily II helicase)